MNVLCALKLTELWNTSLLFDLNYKYIMGASLLALAKSIYYVVFCLYRYECGLSCKLPLESFGIVTNSGRIRNRRLYFDGLLRCIRRNIIFRIFIPAT